LSGIVRRSGAAAPAQRQRLFRILAATLFAAGAFAADPFYLGAWKISSAVVAPWWVSPGQPDAAESKTLVGKTVAIKPAEL